MKKNFYVSNSLKSIFTDIWVYPSVAELTFSPSFDEEDIWIRYFKNFCLVFLFSRILFLSSTLINQIVVISIDKENYSTQWLLQEGILVCKLMCILQDYYNTFPYFSSYRNLRITPLISELHLTWFSLLEINSSIWESCLFLIKKKKKKENLFRWTCPFL